MTLTQFLRARIAEDRAQAEEMVELADDVRSGYEHWSKTPPPANDKRTVACLIDVARRRRAECESKKEIVFYAQGMGTDGKMVLAAMAHQYQDHPDYKGEWHL